MLYSFFSKRLSLQSDQPSTSSGEIARPDVASVSLEYDDHFQFCRHCTALIDLVLTKLTFIGYLFIVCLKGMFTINKFATTVVRVDLCATRTHPLHFILLYSHTKIRLELCEIVKDASVT
jgi:hypothetical protein